MDKSALLNWLFPPKCPFCGRVLSAPGVCESCLKTLPLAQDSQALRKGGGFHLCAFPLFYEGAVRHSLLQYKFGGHAPWAEGYAQLLLPCVAEQLSGDFDCLTWVPVSLRRLRKRGYDQTRLLAEALGRAWETKPLPLLEKVLDNPAQSSLNDAAARRANVLGAYAASSEAKGRRVLLIDDILTTGATLSECVRTLEDAGASSVVCAALAAVREKSKK